MPLPWSLNLWGCNPFAGEPARDAAVDGERLGSAPPPSLADVLVPAPPVKDPADYTAAEWFDKLSADWPTVANVIPSDKHVYKSDEQAVLTFVNKYRASDQQKTYLQCFDYANYQLDVMHFRPSGPAALDIDTMMVLYEYPDAGGVRSEVQVFPMIKAVEYMRQALLNETPVLIGLRLNSPLLSDLRPNERRSTPFIEPTNHFVVAVGMGEDENGKYISFFDYYHAQDERDRLYLAPSLLMESSDKSRTLSEVRLSMAR